MDAIGKLLVHTWDGVEEAEVFWQGNGLAVTRLTGEPFVITHVMTGNAIMHEWASDAGERTLRIAQCISHVLPWNTLSFHDLMSRKVELKAKCVAAIEHAGIK